jgi:hypothetical protein
MKDQRSDKMMSDGHTEMYTLGYSNRNIEEFIDISTWIK